MNAPSSQPVRNGVGSGVVKRRACDECRTRKLACTKEHDGCARCKREGVACNYSAQKPMGRPKKRRGIEQALGDSPTAPAAPTYAPVTAPGEPAVTMPDAATDTDPETLIDPRLSTADANFLDLLGPGFVLTQPFQAHPATPKEVPLDPDIWNFDINFDTHYPPPPAEWSETSSTQFPPPPGLSTTSLSSHEASPPEDKQSPGDADMLTPLPPGGCSCLANLYLALDSIARLPTEVGPALHVARRASRAAHDTIRCQVCFPPLTEFMKVPMSTFRNTMVLGALLPSIADAYLRILDMVEAETAHAVRERRQLRFSLPEYGGVWGELGLSERVCGATARYGDTTVEPTMWRLMVRSLLKSDVYGIKYGTDDGRGKSLSHLGLKDIIDQMDEKSKTRHAEVDALFEAGLPLPMGPDGKPAQHSRAYDGGVPPCRSIILVAKEAMDRLIIA